MEMAATKVYIPKTLKRQAFSAFALKDTNFSRWAREHLERWLRQQNRQATEAFEVIEGEE